MRVAPLGAYFMDDLARAADEARLSAEVTHMHPEGQAGAIAVAVAAGFASRHRGQTDALVKDRLFNAVLAHTPQGRTRDGIATAAGLPLTASVEMAAVELGNGSEVTAPDTVPFSLWVVARHWDDFPKALWSAVSTGGDRDTLGAIVGGIAVLSASARGIPERWLAQREPLRATDP